MTDYNNSLSVAKKLYLAQNQPLDIKTKVETIAEIDQIRYPFIGLKFYVTATDKYYKVATIAPGYLVFATNALQKAVPTGTLNVDYEQIPNVFVGTYSEINAYTDAEKAKLTGIQAGAQVNPTFKTIGGEVITGTGNIPFPTGSEETAATVKTKYESNANTNAYTDAEKAKLTGIQAGAQVNPTFKTIGGEAITGAGNIPFPAAVVETATTVKTKYESNANTNAFTDAEKTKLSGLSNTVSWNFKGTVELYSALESIPTKNANDAFLVNEIETIDGIKTRMLYIYSGTAFPAKGSGIPYSIDKAETLADLLGYEVEGGGSETNVVTLTPLVDVGLGAGTGITSGATRFTYQNFAFMYGKRITRITMRTNNANGISVFKAKNVGNPETYTETLVQVLATINGFNNWNVDIKLASDEVLVFMAATTESSIRFKSGTPNPVGGGIWFRNAIGWEDDEVNIDLGIGLECTESVFVPGETKLNKVEEILQQANILNTTRSVFFGKKFSVLSDSMSAYAGTIPAGYATVYPDLDLNTVESMWWKKLGDNLGMTLEVNNSYAGGRVSNGVAAGNFQSRMTALGNPDVIFIWGGSNDWRDHNGMSPFGTIDYTTPYALNEFTDAYANMLNTLTSVYPNAKIYCVGILKRYNIAGVAGVNVHGITQRVFNQRIKDVCTDFGVQYLDIEGVGINLNNRANYMLAGDLAHLNTAGMDLAYKHILKQIV